MLRLFLIKCDGDKRPASKKHIAREMNTKTGAFTKKSAVKKQRPQTHSSIKNTTVRSWGKNHGSNLERFAC